MRNLFLLFVFGVFFTGSFAQCLPNTSILIPGIYPDSATGLSSGVLNQPYNQVMQLRTPLDTVTNLGLVTVDSITLVSFAGLPPGLTYACNPGTCVFPGGSNGCVLISGTPSQIGTYSLLAITRTKGKLFNLPIPPQIDTIDYYKIVITQTQGLQSSQSLKFELFQNDPNPFSVFTNISYTCPVPMPVNLKVFNLLGKEVYTKIYLSNTGKNIIKLEADDFAPGIYMYSLKIGRAHV